MYNCVYMYIHVCVHELLFVVGGLDQCDCLSHQGCVSECRDECRETVACEFDAPTDGCKARKRVSACAGS